MWDEMKTSTQNRGAWRPCQTGGDFKKTNLVWTCTYIEVGNVLRKSTYRTYVFKSGYYYFYKITTH